MRFFDIDSVLSRTRRFVSGASNVSDEEVKNPVKLAEILRGLLRRLSEAEALIPPEAMEFELEVSTAGATVTIPHNMNCPVRFSVVYWTKVRAGTTYPTTAPILVADELTTDNELVLRSYVAGRAIIRVEPSFKGVAYNA